MQPTVSEIERLRDHHRMAGRLLALEMQKHYPTSAPAEAFEPYLEVAKKSLDRFFAERNLIDLAERRLAMIIIENELRSHYGELAMAELLRVVINDAEHRGQRS